MDAQLCHCEGNFFLPSYDEEVRSVSWLNPHVELLQAVDVFVEVGQHFVKKLLDLIDSIDIARVSEHSGPGRVLHLFAGILDELARRVVAGNGMIILTSPHVIAHLSHPIYLTSILPPSFSQSVSRNFAKSLLRYSASSMMLRKS